MKAFPANPKRILIRSTNWIGDAVMTTPAVRSIRENFPESEISMLVLPWVADVFKYSPRIDNLLYYDRNGRHNGLKGKWKLGRELAREQFDCAILLQNAFEAALISCIAGIPVRGGYTTDARGLLLSHGVKKAPDIGLKHQVHYYQEMVQGLGLKPSENKLEMFVPEEIQQKARQRLLQLTTAQAQRPLIGFNPGAAYGPAKRWPAKQFADLARRICMEMDADIAVFGTEADQATASLIGDSVPEPDRILDFTGKTQLIEAIALIQCCSAFVTNDSGLMHVAAALDTPLVAIFGSTDHIATGPFSERAKIIRKDLPCSPCKKTDCPKQHLNCLRSISSEEVLVAIQELLH
ncbi:lipopolysaccharide heptosyltransferase II [Desulfogranum japonicum]|uniref:lipopolysaccharide heptosyltransferase II n=1 Tax=Desulfogranum japonicum TaxID=231447 RepID=UPI0003F96E87|nr:lipopolysaccharide heptosyltransferase II [Desulfogranum japonicum]